MTLSAGLACVPCPECGEPIMLTGVTFGDEPELLTACCAHCESLIEFEVARLHGRPRKAKPN